jgi:hypothetical protein
MRVIRALLIAILGWGASQAWASAQTESETLIAFGGGTISSWVTEYSLANRTSTSTSVYLGNTPEVPTVCPPLTGCSQFAISVSVPANGSARSFGPAVGFGTMHLKSTDNSTPPTVRARIINTAFPSQSGELPVFRLATLLAMNPPQLVFPGATRSGSSHSNLVLAVLRAAGDFTPRTVSAVVEVYAGSGQLLGSRELDLECCQTLFLIDVVGNLGITSLDQGQIRVVKTGGNGVLWGIMPSLNADGTVSVSLGVNP